MEGEEGQPAMLQQYSKQLNVYDSTETQRARLKINSSGQFEIANATGVLPVLIKNLFFQGEFPDTPHSLSAELFTIKSDQSTETVARVALAGLVAYNSSSESQQRFLINQRIDSEESARISAVTSVASDLAQESANRISANVTLTNSIANEATSRSAADGVHTTSIANNGAAIVAESKRADDEEKRIVGLVSAEVTARTTAVATATAATATEKGRAEAAESKLASDILDVMSSAEALVAQEQQNAAVAVGNEQNRATQAEEALSSRIDNVLSNIDQAAIDSFTEVVTALGASGAGGLSGAINQEVTARQIAVGDLQAQIDILRGVILTLQAGN